MHDSGTNKIYVNGALIMAEAGGWSYDGNFTHMEISAVHGSYFKGAVGLYTTSDMVWTDAQLSSQYNETCTRFYAICP